MLTVSLQEFLALVEQHSPSAAPRRSSRQPQREKILRSDQTWRAASVSNERRLATCPQCDAVVDSEIIHPRSGLCPICHSEAQYQR